MFVFHPSSPFLVDGVTKIGHSFQSVKQNCSIGILINSIAWGKPLLVQCPALVGRYNTILIVQYTNLQHPCFILSVKDTFLSGKCRESGYLCTQEIQII